jgi:hypothetical protein
MKLVDLDQTIFVPVVDEAHGGVTVEMKMTVGEFFARCCKGFEPEVVEAIPVEWLQTQLTDEAYDELILRWQKEQEAQNG